VPYRKYPCFNNNNVNLLGPLAGRRSLRPLPGRPREARLWESL